MIAPYTIGGININRERHKLPKSMQNEEEWVKVARLISEVKRMRVTVAPPRELGRWQSSVIVTIDLDRNAHFLFAGRYESQQRCGGARGWWAAHGNRGEGVGGGGRGSKAA